MATASHRSVPPALPDDVQAEAVARGHRPTFASFVRPTNRSAAYWKFVCDGADCTAELRLFSTERAVGTMLARSCGPFRVVDRRRGE